MNQLDKKFILLLSLLLGFCVFFLLKNALKFAKNSSMGFMRTSHLRFYARGGFSNYKVKLNIQKGFLTQVIGSKFVAGQYRQEINRMLLSSGDVEEMALMNFVSKKIIWSLFAIGLTFSYLIINNLSALPICLFFVVFSYFIPNLIDGSRNTPLGGYSKVLLRMRNQMGIPNNGMVSALAIQKTIFSICGFVCGYFYLFFKNGNFANILFSLILVIFAFLLPDLLLFNKTIKRKSLISETLADVVESLFMCVGAGLAFSGALDRVSKQNKGPIPEEFGRVLNEMQVGKSRSDSLLSMSERCGQRELTKFVQTINQIDKYGIPISSALKEIAKDLRLERRAKAREMGQKIPVKILAPIMLCFLPCVVIIVLTPAAISIINGIIK